MQVKAVVTLQSLSHLSMFAGGVVIHDQMKWHSGRSLSLQLAQKAQNSSCRWRVK